MRILQVIHYFSPLHGGGSINVAYNLSKHLVERGHSVTIFTSDFELDKEYINSLGGVRVVPFHCIANIGGMLISPNMNKQLKEEINSFDVIHMHNFRSYQNIIAHYYAKKYNIPYVLQPDNSTPRVIEKQKLKGLFDIFFGNKVIKDASKVIVISKDEDIYYKQMGIDDKKIIRIYFGMDMKLFENLPERGKFKEKYKIIGKMILYLGRINKTKGIDFSIKAFAEITNKADDLVYVIAGPDDGYKAELEKLIKKLDLNEKIKFIGYVDDKDKIAAYVDADLLLHTVLYMGGVGIVPLEAILCNTPVIVTEECGEIIKEANAGYLVEYNNVRDLRDTMKYALENPKKGKEMCERGKKYLEENLTWEKIVKKVETVYGDCIQNI